MKKIQIVKTRNFIFKKKKEILFLFLFLVLSFWSLVSSIPSKFEPNSLITIEKGGSLKQIANDLKEKNLIRSKIVFSVFLIIQAKDDNIIAGEYLFHEPTSVFEIAKRLTKGDYGIDFVTVTIPEGTTLNGIANIMEKSFVKFDREIFQLETIGFEGYYFPDTYSFPENIDTYKIIEALSQNFERKINEVSDLISSSSSSLDEIIVMASIIEKEATRDTMQDISNILWKRMEIGMPLQVDAPFVYEQGKNSFTLTISDLRRNTPYNTYTNLGLPPTAISNPGLESIKAAASPQPTEYLYFLTGRDGKMYYAETHDEHVENKAKYLR